MKKIVLITMALGVGVTSLFAQKKMVNTPENLKNVKVVRTHDIYDAPVSPFAKANPYVVQKPRKVGPMLTAGEVTEAIIGITRYDLQTNSSVQNRIFVHPDGKIGATWTYGMDDAGSFSDRGTGYNYYDGSAWGSEPGARVESARCGWPSYCPLGTDGELIMSHNGSTGLILSKRTSKGTGAWAQSVLTGPAASDGTTALLWPRVITVGNTIHVIATTNQGVAPAVITYQGLQLALVYVRSTDGGATWDAPRILEGMDSATVVNQFVKGFGGDMYAWAEPKGNTIAFVIGNEWGGLFIEKSTDGGDNWTKIPVYTFPTITSFPTPRIYTTDCSIAIALDDNGKAHVCSGRTAVNATTQDSAFWYPYTDGLLYWNEYMSPLDSGMLSNDSALFADGKMIGHMWDWNQDDSLGFPEVNSGQYPFGVFNISLSSMPQIVVNGSDVYVTYSSCMETLISDVATPNKQMYRHMLYTRSKDGGATWLGNIDLNSDAAHDVDECIFGSLAYGNGMLHMVYQADVEPGLNVRGDADGPGDNSIYYMIWDPSIIDGINDKSSLMNEINVYPNPSNDYSFIDLTLRQTQNVTLNVTNMMGQQIFNHAYGNLSAGDYTLSVESGKFSSGIYFYTIKTGNNTVTHKMIVE